MPATGQLHALIRTMTPSEKGYFKKFAYKQSGKRHTYLELFDAIDAQIHFDEQALVLRFNEGSTPDNFSNAGSYLFKLILSNLVEYHAGKSTHDRLLTTLREIHLLLQKKLYSTAKRKIEYAHQISKTGSYSIYKPLIAELETQLAAFTSKQ